MRTTYALLEDLPILKSNQRINIYITPENLYFVKINSATPELKSLSKRYFAFSRIGYRFGLLGALLIIWPIDAYYRPKIREAKMVALDMLRDIDEAQLNKFDGYACSRDQLAFEEKKKDTYKVHIGDAWILLTGDAARSLQNTLSYTK